jgi:hypothetical protein
MKKITNRKTKKRRLNLYRNLFHEIHGYQGGRQRRRHVGDLAPFLQIPACTLQLQPAADDIASSLNCHVNEYRNFMYRRATHKPASFKKWPPPRSEFLKISTDGSFYSQSHTGAWGFIVRGEGEVLLAAGIGNLEHVPSALHA